MLTPRAIPLVAGALLAVISLYVLTPSAAAQDVWKYELSAGYAYMRVDSGAGGLSLHGVSFSLARNVNRWFAIVGDGGGYHLEGFRLGTVQVGPRFTARTRQRASIFSQALLGFAHANAGARGFPSYHESLAWTIGGGVDCRVSEYISLRLVQAEYMQTRLGGGVQDNFRVGSGIVLHFGAPD
jgi:opacity protein-like surface antigen